MLGDALKWNINVCVNQILIRAHGLQIYLTEKYESKTKIILGFVKSQANFRTICGISVYRLEFLPQTLIF